MEKYTIIKEQWQKVRRFNLTARKTEFKLNAVPYNEDPVKWVKDGISDVLRRAVSDLQPTDKVGITFCTKNFERGPGWMNFKDARDVTFVDVWEMLSSIFQSNSEGFSTDTFCLSVTSVRLPAGSGRGRRYNNFDEECTKRKGIVTINNADNKCLPRAIIVGKAYVDNDPEYARIRKDRGRLQTTKAEELLAAAGVVIGPNGAGVLELRKFQNLLASNYQLCVYQYGSKGRDVMFEGPSAPKRINLLHHQNHYNVIVSLTAAFCTIYYCEECHRSYASKSEHRCGGTCPSCLQSPACPKVKNVSCPDCNKLFRGPECFAKHKVEGSLNKGTVCGQLRRCGECLKTVKADRQHTCGEIFCKICNKHQPQPHLCYIQQDTRRPKTENVVFVFYDLEARQEEKYGDDAVVHEPNLCVHLQRCFKCLHDETSSTCSKCGIRRGILTYKPIEMFMEHLLQLRKKLKQVVVIAHNGQAYDHQMVLNYVLTKTTIKPQLILRGTKILLMQIDNIKFIDSLNYFPMALAALPKAFGLADTFKKGYFPHLFNTVANQNYIGPLPAIEYYDCDSMKGEAREAFLKWYHAQEDTVFNFQKELKEYCVSDVRILAEACLKFRQIMLDECNVCPYTEGVTIASTCQLVFRRMFLQPQTIGLIPKNGYRLTDNQSVVALKWLMGEASLRNIKIQHAGNGKEVVLHGHKVDGYCAETNQIFEFHGCYYHGHPLCLPHNRNEPVHDDPEETLETCYQRTVATIGRLRGFGYDVVEKWQCEYEDNDDDVSNMLLPLNPRDAFFGGRTENIRKYYKCKEGEKIKYVDVCSLYPYVCKRGKFPVGHPTVYVGSAECAQVNLQQTTGLIKCVILPPQDLYHPVLPIKMHSKLMFLLCRTCCKELNQSECGHGEKDRALEGTWVIDEVVKAMELGYRMLAIHEIWSYKTVQMDEKTDGIFTAMMNKFLKLKQQASGWPANCDTQEEKERYIEQFLANEGIWLEGDKICKNPGLRTLAKLILNSFWGKFGQRENQPKTSVVHQPAELFKMVTNPATYVNDLLPINEDTVVVGWQYKDDVGDTLPTVNVCIASHVTAQARLKLFSYLEQLGDRVLYLDTDSCIYRVKDGEWEPHIGEFIGDMTDELIDYGPGAYISEFVSAGPKNYAFKVESPSSPPQLVCKAKGIRISYKNAQVVNLDAMKELILQPDKAETTPILVCDRQFRRTAEHRVKTVNVPKLYRVTSNKRKYFDNFDSVPYGYKKLRTSNVL